MVNNSFFLLVWISTVLSFFNFKLSESTNLYTLLNKILLDEFFLINYYFIWSNFFFLFLFSIMFFMPFFLNKSYYFFKSTTHILHVVVFLSFLACMDYFYFNNYNFENQFFLKNYNVLLANSVNKIHPFLLYNSIYFLISLSFFNFFNLNYSHKEFFLIKKFYNFIPIFLYGNISIFLGSWWALQEGSWGGYWDWDISEVFGFFILSIFLKLLHSKTLLLNLEFSYVCMSKYICLLLVYYLFMQLNFNLISHNFNLHVSVNVYVVVIYSLLIIYTGVILLKKLQKLSKCLKFISIFFLKKFRIRNLRVYVMYFVCLITILILSSTLLILSDWLWQNFSIGFFISITSFTKIMLFLFFLVISIYWVLNAYSFLLFFIFSFILSKYGMILIFCISFSSTLFVNLHFVLLLILLFNFLFFSTEISFWHFLNYGFNFCNYYFYNSFKLDEPFINFSKDVFLTNFSKNKNFNWWYNFSVLDFKIFELYYNYTGVIQIFIHDSLFNSFFSVVNSKLENIFLSFFIVIVCFLFSSKSKKYIIVF